MEAVLQKWICDGVLYTTQHCHRCKPITIKQFDPPLRFAAGEAFTLHVKVQER